MIKKENAMTDSKTLIETNNQRWHLLDNIRGVCIILVVLYHVRGLSHVHVCVYQLLQLHHAPASGIYRLCQLCGTVPG